MTPPTGFEIRTGANAFATTPVTLTQSSGTVSLTTIDARFTPGTSGTFSANITATSTGATTKNIAVSGNGVTNYYSLESGDLDVLATWGTLTNGNGSHPSDFTSNYQVFNIRNNSTPTIAASWTVSGTGSKIILGDGSTAVNFTIPDAMTVTGPIDLTASSTLTLQNVTVAHTYGTVNASSTVNYAQSSTATVAVMTFGNLTLTGGTKLFDHGTTTISGNLVIDGATNVDGATTSAFTTLNVAGNITLQNTPSFNAITTGRMTIVCNGSSVQTIKGNGNSLDIFRLTVSNSAGVVLSTTGGTTNIVAGNASGGGITMSLGNLSTNSNTITLFSSSGSSILNETTAKYITGTVIVTKTVGTGAHTLGNIGATIVAGTDDLGDVTVTRVTGTNGIITVSAKSGISRTFTVSSTNAPSSGRDINFKWTSNDYNSKDMINGVVFKSTNNGTDWINITSGNYSVDSVSLTGQTTFGKYTISDASNLLPVELVSFTATASGRGVELAWKTATEVNNAGFEVEKNVNGSWSKLGFVEGNGTSNAPKSYSYTDASAKGTVSYRLKQIDRDGKFTYSNVVNASVKVTAADYQLSQNFPNPFNPNTSISFAMKNAEHVNVSVYNALGQVVATLFNDVANADQLYTLNFDGRNLSSGTYFYSLRSASRN
ncbi:MAG: beta strand repeat-containing protein, partial [Bacteroidota bacterium]